MSDRRGAPRRRVGGQSQNSIAKDETERLELVGSLARIVGAVNNDATKIHALADRIVEHPDVFDLIQQHREGFGTVASEKSAPSGDFFMEKETIIRRVIKKGIVLTK